jgi:signal transduction histidine kinase
VLISVLSILGLGTFLSFFIMRLLSKGFVRTEVENVEKQKQFITNASHELKTPLAVIKANTEMQEMMDGESEWSQSTLRQVDRMTGLIGNLVQIARAQEMTDGELAPTDIAAAVSETADSFAPVAASDGKKLEKEIPDSLVIKSSDSSMRQLTSLLVDNAIKYCDDGGTIKVELARSRRGAVLTVSNDYAEGANVDYSRFFERFYRQDEAHTISAGRSEGTSGEHTNKSGYGIGLSIAESLVKSMKGSIDVSWNKGRILFTCKF